jgi:pimeloyl-ACP methyl ester carboxylesterase
MPVAVADGIPTRYEMVGAGPPLLAFSPGGFNATLDNWSSLGIYRDLGVPGQLAGEFTCITFDRRESGRSGGRVERVSWDHYAAQGKALLDHLGIARVHLIGGCAGCSVAAAFASAYPDRVLNMVMFWPAGGARYRLSQQDRFARHLSFVSERGLDGVVSLTAGAGPAPSFGGDPRLGPWVTVIRGDQEFAAAYQRIDPSRYQVIVSGMARLLFDRDTVPGAEPEDLLGLDVPALIIPGQDRSHATSAARYLEECLPRAEYWDVPVASQTRDAVVPRLRRFLAQD